MRFACVQPNLFVGPNPLCDVDFEELKSQNITAILSLQTEEDLREGGMDLAQEAATTAGLVFRSVPVRDFDPADLALRLPDCVTALERLLNDGHAVYVHCTAGVNRSPTVVIAYLHWCGGWGLEQAVFHLQSIRNCSPNPDAIRRARWTQPR